MCMYKQNLLSPLALQRSSEAVEGSKDPLSKRSYLFSPLQAGFGLTLMAKNGHADIAKQPTTSSGKLGLLLTMRGEIDSQSKDLHK